MYEGAPKPNNISSDSDPLPFSKIKVEESEEMRKYQAGACGLPENATWEEIDDAEEKALTKKAAAWLGISIESSWAEVQAELDRRGFTNNPWYSLALDIGPDPRPSELAEAQERADAKKVALWRTIAAEMQQNRSKEQAPEHIPTPEEVVAVFEKVTGGRPYTELKRKEDEKGLYIWEIKLSEPDNEGTTTEYWYKRDGTYAQKGDSKKIPGIHVAFFDIDGMPTGGSSVAKYKKDGWEYV